MATQEEEWILKIIDEASGNATKIASSASLLDTAQLKTIKSAVALNQALRTVESAKAAAAASPSVKATQRVQDASVRAALLGASQQASAQDLVAKAARAAVAEQAKANKSNISGAKQAKKWFDDAARATASDQSKAAKLVATQQAKAASAAKASAAAQKSASAESVKAITSPIASATDALNAMGPKGAAAAVAIKAVFAVATVAVLATAGALYKAFEAAIQIVALRAQLLATFAALSGGANNGAKTLAIVERLGVALPFATTKLAEWGTELQKAGLQGRSLERAIRASAAASALMGEAGGAAARNLISQLALGGAGALQLVGSLRVGGPEARAQLAEMGLRVRDVAAALGLTVAQFRSTRISAKQMAGAVESALAKKGAAPLAAQMLSFDSIIGRAKEGILSLFDGLGPAIKPFMESVSSLFGEFNKGGDAIKSLKPIVQEVMTAVFVYATKAVEAIHALGKAVVPVAQAIWKFGTSEPILRGLKVAFTVIGVAVAMLLLPLAAIVAVGSLAVAAFVAIQVAAVWLAGTVAGAWDSVSTAIPRALGAAWAAIVEWIDGAKTVGADFVGSIVLGIVGGNGLLVQAIKGMGKLALGAFRAVFDMHSPSKILLHDGEHNMAGAVATGIDRGAPKVEESMARLGPDDSSGGSVRARGTRDGGSTRSTSATPAGRTFNFYNCIFGDGTSEEQVDSWMSAWWGRMGASDPEPEAT